MKAGANSYRGALLTLVGPLVWAAHFFAVYLSEAMLCSLDSTVYANIARAAGLAFSMIAVSFLIWMSFRARRGIWPSVSRPLIDVSIVAVILSSIPLLMLRACLPAAG